MLYYFTAEKLLKEKTKKELLSLFRKVLTTISKLKLQNIDVDVSANFHGNTFTFEVTVYSQDGNNKSFTAYDFQKIDKLKKAFGVVLDAIRKDNFTAIEGMEFTV